ncbi:MAG: crossover junction endodeoxyribonuclease RuvC [Gemmatimonadaceae bacterium]|nr:crossover junction endodeoxyribonuclease RuvC [Gemmatimonadaceae bacterium]
MLALGVDPGTAVTGYGLVRLRPGGQMSLVECGVIRTKSRDPLPSRLAGIFDGIVEIIERHRPDALALEDVFYARNVRTTVALGHARGVIMLAGERAGLTVHEFAPAVVKKAVVGAGAASKDQVQFMVTRLLRLQAPPTPSDAADGVAAAITLCMRTRVPTIAALTAAPRARPARLA